MKILMLNPPFLPMFSRSSRSPAVTKSSTLYYPFFLAYATGVLEDAGFDVLLMDACAARLDHDAALAAIEQYGPDFVVCETSTPSIENDLEFMGVLKEKTGAFIVAVGTHVSALPDEVLTNNPFVDVIARREYELTVLELARQFKEHRGGIDLSGIDGVSFVRDDEICHNTDRRPIDDLDRLPFVSRVYRDHLRTHLNSYFYGANLHPVVTILSGRGCPHRCAYCVYPQTMTGHSYRLRSVSNLVDELEFIRKELPEVKEIFIEDDTLTVDREHARAISREICRRGLKIKWSTNSRADVDYETMRLMHKAGCRLLCVGFESASQRILDGLQKHIKRDNYFRFRKDAARAGLLVHGCFMYGNEGETRQTMEETLKMAIELDCDTAQFYPIMVYPGTRSYDYFKEKNLIKAGRYRDWLTPEGLHNCVVSLPGISSEELVAFCDYSRKKYYLRPGYVFSKVVQMLKSPREAKRIFRAARTMFRFLFRPSLRQRSGHGAGCG